MSKYMKLNDNPIVIFDHNSSSENLKTYKKNIKFIEKFDAFDSDSDFCLLSPELKKNSNNVIENFQLSDNKFASKTIDGLNVVAKGADEIAGKMKNSMSGIIGSAIENLQKPEFKDKVKNIVDDYSGIIVDSISRTLADPSHQHKVDEYIVKPFWDLYIIPFIDMYVIFLIMYYVIFMTTMIWIRKNT